MARFQASLLVRRAPEVTFAFVSDFRHAPTWDPRTYEATKTTDGPIGPGTRFMLLGGLFPKDARVCGVTVPRLLRGEQRLPYEITVHPPSRELELAGETDALSYHDHLQFSPEGADTRLVYTARIELKGLLKVGEPLLRLLFARIGTGATQGIPDAVVRGTT